MRSAMVCGLAVLMSAGMAQAVIVIDPGHWFAAPGTQIQIPIQISSNPLENMDSVSLAAAIGDGGPIVGGTNQLTITAVQYVGAGHVFNGNALPQQDGLVGFAIYQGAEATQSGTVPANGILATLIVDIPASAPVGVVYPLVLRGGDFAMNTQVFGPNASPPEVELVSQVLEGSIFVGAVPEPATGLLLLALSPLLRRRGVREGILA